MSRALLFSLLVRQQLMLGASFRLRYPHPWLVWEAGVWNVPDASEQNSASTRLPSDSLHDCLPTGDVLCFELEGSGVPVSLTLGRSEKNALVVNDATVSREHLQLWSDGQGAWEVELMADGGQATLDGLPLTPGQRQPLASGARLQLGDVRMTFLPPEPFYARVEAQAARASASRVRAG